MATIRKKGFYKVGQTVVVRVGSKVMKGRVIAVSEPTEEALSQYVVHSGFSTVKEWLAEAERLHRKVITQDEFEIIVVEIERE